MYNDMLLKIASHGGSHFREMIEFMDKEGMLQYMLPDIFILKQFNHCKKFHPEGPTVYDHILAALDNSRSNDPVVNIAILFHDIGKSRVHKYDEVKQRDIYHGHDIAGIRVLDKLAKEIGIPEDDLEIYKFCCKEHMRFHLIKEMRKEKVKSLVTHKHFNYLKEVAYADSAARAKEFFNESDWKEIEEKINEFNE